MTENGSDELRQAWRAGWANAKLTADAERLRAELDEGDAAFEHVLARRDWREIVILIGLIPAWIWLGRTGNVVWTWYLEVPALAAVAGFMLWFRHRHGRVVIDDGATLKDSLVASFRQVDAQIWLLRNILWCYLVPIGLPIAIFFVHTAWAAADSSAEAFAISLPVAMVAGVYWMIHRLNQRGVKAQLLPRRDELVRSLASLRGEAEDDWRVDGRGARLATRTPLWDMVRTTPIEAFREVATFALVVAATAGVLAALAFGPLGPSGSNDGPDRRLRHDDYPRLSPFENFRWRGDQPEVVVGGRWYRPEAIDGIAIDDILQGAERLHGPRWRKRFVEDLVELMDRLGHPLDSAVDLRLRPVDGKDTLTIRDVPMTRENRRAVYGR